MTYLADRVLSLIGLHTKFRYFNPVSEYYKYGLVDSGEQYLWAMSETRKRYRNKAKSGN